MQSLKSTASLGQCIEAEQTANMLSAPAVCAVQAGKSPPEIARFLLTQLNEPEHMRVILSKHAKELGPDAIWQVLQVGVEAPFRLHSGPSLSLSLSRKQVWQQGQQQHHGANRMTSMPLPHSLSFSLFLSGASRDSKCRQLWNCLSASVSAFAVWKDEHSTAPLYEDERRAKVGKNTGMLDNVVSYL